MAHRVSFYCGEPIERFLNHRPVNHDPFTEDASHGEADISASEGLNRLVARYQDVCRSSFPLLDQGVWERVIALCRQRSVLDVEDLLDVLANVAGDEAAALSFEQALSMIEVIERVEGRTPAMSLREAAALVSGRPAAAVFAGEDDALLDEWSLDTATGELRHSTGSNVLFVDKERKGLHVAASWMQGWNHWLTNEQMIVEAEAAFRRKVKKLGRSANSPGKP
jgi:prepilin-type processing-associated H-X9-DG protein